MLCGRWTLSIGEGRFSETNRLETFWPIETFVVFIRRRHRTQLKAIAPRGVSPPQCSKFAAFCFLFDFNFRNIIHRLNELNCSNINEVSIKKSLFGRRKDEKFHLKGQFFSPKFQLVCLVVWKRMNACMFSSIAEHRINGRTSVISRTTRSATRKISVDKK